MPAKITAVNNNSVTVEIKIEFNKSMLETENKIQETLNEAGVLVTGQALKSFDTNGAALIFGSVKMSSKGLAPKEYQTPYGVVSVDRHVYQTSSGGKTFCPLENNARIIVTSTPKFAQQVSHKFAEMASPQVQKDLEINHGRHVTRCFLQDIAEAVGTVAMAQEKTWEYDIPKQDRPVHMVSIGLDGTCMLLCDDGYRQAMVGTLTLYDREGERLHTIYIASAPEYGKEKFKQKLRREIECVRELYPKANFIGLADGAKDNWEFLEQLTNVQITDFYHATEYLTGVSEALFSKKQEKERQQWLENHCHDLKHEKNAAVEQLEEFKKIKKEKALSEEKEGKIDAAISYFFNQGKRMNYAEFRAQHMPIGSGVTEAACKTIIKQRLCKSGMKWKDKGAKVVLSLRTLTYSSTRWDQFWNKINCCGIQCSVI